MVIFDLVLVIVSGEDFSFSGTTKINGKVVQQKLLVMLLATDQKNQSVYEEERFLHFLWIKEHLKLTDNMRVMSF